jgi:hypothetical protein
MDESDNRDLSPTFLAPSAGEKEQSHLSRSSHQNRRGDFDDEAVARNSKSATARGRASDPEIFSRTKGRLHPGRLEAVTPWRGS